MNYPHVFGSDNEAEMINKVALDVTAMLGFTPSKDFDDFIGIEARMMEIKSKLILQSEEVKVIGVVGPPGIGKTTIATVLYNQISPGFPFSTFLENIKGSYEKPCGNNYRLKLRLQKNLLSEIFNQRDIEVCHLGVAQEMLGDKKVLVVLDEVGSWWQLEATADQRGWLGPGSMIIITTEDKKLLKALGLGINHIYEMEFPTSSESLQIFCQYAFGKNSPDNGFEWLAWEVTGLSGDLPLGLRVMGSYLRGMSRDYWIDALPRLRSSLDTEIESTLRFSYDVLSDKDKALFLHIACFFVGFEEDFVKRCLEKSGLDVNHGLQVLANKSLLSIENGYVKMHCLLQQMGREIVKKESLEEPGHRQFLMDTMEISDVLEEDTGTGKVLGVKLDTSNSKKIQISKSFPRAFQGMNNLQFLYVSSNTLCIPEGLICLPHKLRLIDWNGCPLRFWPSKFSGKFLVEIRMPNSKFEKLWEGTKLLQVSEKDSGSLKSTSLEELNLSYCKSLLELTSSIGNATKLTIFNLRGCLLLKELPSSIGRSERYCDRENAIIIQHLVLALSIGYNRVYKHHRLPDVPDSIVELVLSCTGIEEVPPSIVNLFRLRILLMYGCKKLKSISPNISKLENLELLALCNRDVNAHYLFPICLPEKALSSPISLRLAGDSVETIPDCIRSLSGLIKLNVIACKKLVALPPLPACKYAFLPGEKVPAHVTHRASSGSLTINLTPTPLLSSFRFKSCILLSEGQAVNNSLMDVSFHVMSKQNGLIVGRGSTQLHIPYLSRYGEHLYIFEDSFSLNQDSPEAEEATFSELTFVFKLHDKTWKVKGCGVQFLEGLQCITDRNEDDNVDDDVDDDDDDDGDGDEICALYQGSYSLNLQQKAKKLIQTLDCKSSLVPGVEVPAHFTHQSTSGSQTINLTPESLPSSFRFKACILLSRDKHFVLFLKKKDFGDANICSMQR
ncbi:hypothetical protein IGI04_015303 [Brassica rapa subsp. trilocularis]|uniref:ADP-ribosyl cyclase/cyclic ADP-ribose hydrolase n=1 Tax=Brassica rapa subsp. trilocularis TaxID=1813537 RepID=A0ABQ7MPN1_BRACM|nr:hypothetical protein IGI04_015303 [Brassica rapa subsp. trilocularis]